MMPSGHAATLDEALRQSVSTLAVSYLVVDLWRARQLAEAVAADLRGSFRVPLLAAPNEPCGHQPSDQDAARALALGWGSREPAPFCAGRVHLVAAEREVSLTEAEGLLAAGGVGL
jgi:hypothetical protein